MEPMHGSPFGHVYPVCYREQYNHARELLLWQRARNMARQEGDDAFKDMEWVANNPPPAEPTTLYTVVDGREVYPPVDDWIWD